MPGTEGHSLHKAPSKVFGPMRGPGVRAGDQQRLFLKEKGQATHLDILGALAE